MSEIIEKNTYVRLNQIVGSKTTVPPTPAMINISKSAWWAGVKLGRYPKPIRLSSRTVVWRLKDITELLDSLAAKDYVPACSRKERNRRCGMNITQAANLGIENKVQQGYSTHISAQCERLLNRLQAAPLSTLQAREELDIMHPAGRVRDLRGHGHNIITEWTLDDTGKALHRVAFYVLLGAGND